MLLTEVRMLPRPGANKGCIMKQYAVGYAAGVFDLFHIGHLNLLRRAKEQCDYLVVGVVVDEICFAAKGKRPFIPVEERLEIVSAIRYVDEAVLVTPDIADKTIAWKMHRFNCLFSGDDWKGHPAWVQMEKNLKALGADVVFFPYTRLRTSTDLRNAIAGEAAARHE